MSCFIIAEAGVNHNGDAKLAAALVEAAAEAGADAVKFQTFQTEELVRRDTPKVRYQLETTEGEANQWSMLKGLELNKDLHFRLREQAYRLGIEFLSTAFDRPSLKFLVEQVHVSRIKIPSGEITNAPLLLQAGRTRLPIILSTGMSTLGDVEAALEVIAFGRMRPDEIPESRTQLTTLFGSREGWRALDDSVSLLHCTSSYPAPADTVHLRAMTTLRHAFQLPVGYSDHSMGTAVSVAAVALGATVIEKHMTIDCNLPGPDHRASLEPHDFGRMVREIRTVEAALGSSIKHVDATEQENRSVARKSIVAARDLSAGEVLTLDNMTVKRPADGRSALDIWSLIGRAAPRRLAKDELIDF